MSTLGEAAGQQRLKLLQAAAAAAGNAAAGSGGGGAFPPPVTPSKPAKLLRARATNLFKFYLRGAAEQGGVGDQISLGKQYRTAVATRVSPLSCVPVAGRPRVVLCGTAGGYYQLAAELEAQHHFDPTLLD